MTKPNEAEGRVKASLYLSDEKREKIRATGLTLEDYFNRIHQKYESFEMDRWNNGTFWKSVFRVAFTTSDTLNLILSKLDEEAQYRAGLEAGAKIRKAIEVSTNATPEELSQKSLIECINEYHGWGNLMKQGESSIIVIQPLFEKPHFPQGYLEGFLGIKLQIIEANHTRVAYKILK